MAGIIATIIAARKRHYTFAWVIGIWTAIAVILALCGMGSVAIAPGWIFLVIAIGMKKIPEEGSDASPAGTPVQNTASASIPASIEASPPTCSPVESLSLQEEEPPEVRSFPAPAVIRFCRYCGQELEPGAKFCRHCGARLE